MKNKICENCRTKIINQYGSDRFCSANCARSFSRKNDIRSKTKICNCKECGKEIEVNKRTPKNNVLCNECRTKNIVNKENKREGLKRYSIRREVDDFKIIKKCKYCGQEICLRKDICKKYVIFPSLIKYFGFEKNKIGTIELYEEYERIKNLVVEDYWNKKLSVEDIKIKVNGNSNEAIRCLMRSMGINRRKDFEGMLVAQSNKSIYKSGYHIDWQNKKHFYRSSYELDYYKVLDEQKIEYETEKLRILYWDTKLLKQRVSIPDIYLPSKNLIVEIKGSYFYDEQNIKDMVKSYKEHGYRFKLILDHKEIDIK